MYVTPSSSQYGNTLHPVGEMLESIPTQRWPRGSVNELQKAVYGRSIERTIALLERDRSTLTKATSGVDAICVAAEAQHVETMAMLMDAGVVDTGPGLLSAARWGERLQ